MSTRLAIACLLAGLVAVLAAAPGISVRAADVGAAAVDEPQYLLTALSLWEDGDLDISDERAQGRADAFHQAALPVQTAVLADGRRVSPHDPLLPLLLAPAMGLGGWVTAKAFLVLLGGLLAAATAWLIGTRWPVSSTVAGAAAALATSTAPLAVYAHQVYPEIVAALAVVIAVGAILPPLPDRAGWPGWAFRPDRARQGWSGPRAVVLVAAVSALPWLAAKYIPVALALAVVALARMRQGNPRLAALTTAALGVSGAWWLAGHQLLYGGWTAYAAGDHFSGRGEFSAVGFAPDLLGRSSRLVGLLVDSDYGLVAWQPAWLLVLPALGWMIRARGAGLGALGMPLLAGWLTAVFVALTMHGYWWPGRQVVVVLPLAAIVVAVALSGWAQSTRTTVPGKSSRARHAVIGAAVALSAIGVAVQAWVLIAGRTGSVTWVGAPYQETPAALVWMRSTLPTYRVLDSSDWVLHGLWVAVCAALFVVGLLAARPCHDAVRPYAGAGCPRSDKELIA